MVRFFKFKVHITSELKFPLLKLAVITVAVIAVYFQDLSLVFADSLQYEGYSYILIIPALITYLIYRKRNVLTAAVLKEDKNRTNLRYLPTLAGVLLCLVAFALYVFGSQTFSPLQYHVISLPIFVAGLVLILFNLATLRHAIFPIVFLAFLTPPPEVFLNNVGSLLSVGSTEAANGIANSLGVESWISMESGTPVINLIRPNNQPLLLAVDIACSGIYSLVGFAVFAAFFAYIVRDKIWKKFAIVGIGFPLIYLLNIIRITLIVLIGYQWGAELALEVFHVLGGWVLVFLGTLLLLVIAEKILKTQIFAKANIKDQDNNAQNLKVKNDAPPMQTSRRSTKKVQYYKAAKILAVLLVALLIVYVQSPVFALSRGPGPILVETSNGQQGNLELFPQIDDYRIGFLYRDTNFEELSGQDFSLAFEYYPEKLDDPRVGVLLEIAETSIALHQWEVCLVQWPIAQGWQPVAQLELRDIRIQEDPIIIARYFAFQEQNRDQIQLVLYYYTTGVFEIDGTNQQKRVKISFITYFDDLLDLDIMENKLLPFAESTVNYWEPVRKWNTITLMISQNIIPLAAIPTTFLIALLPFNWILKRKRFKANASIYQKLHPQKKKTIDVIKETETKNIATFENIVETSQKTITQPLDKDELMKNLVELEELGLIKSIIIAKRDEPVYIWKTQF